MASSTLYTSYSQHSNATITVTNTSELKAAMAQLTSSGGGTIELDGNGGPYKIVGNGIGDANNPILIKAMDPATPPDVTEIYLLNASHVTMTELNVDSSILANPLPYHDVRISLSDNIEFVDNTMSSNASGYLGGGSAVKGGSASLIRDSQQINFSHNYIQDYAGGAGFLEVKGLTFSNNEMTGIQHDGFQAGGLQNAVISNNYMHDFYGSTQQVNHSDFIMIWGTNAKSVTTNVQISGNVLDTGNGAALQGIFIGNNQIGGSGPSGQMFQNIDVFDNVVHSAMHHGITVGQTNGANIYDNTVLFNENSFTQHDSTSAPVQNIPWIMTSGSPGAVVTGNVAGVISIGGGADPTVNNYLLDYNNPNSANYVENHIVNSTGIAGIDLRDLSFLPTSPLYGNFGATLSSSADPNEPVTAVMRVTELEGYRGAVQLTGDLSIGNGAPLDPAGASYVWTLDDGTVINGVGGTHVFQTPGNHEVTLQVTDSAGNVDTITRVFHVQDQTNFDISFDNGAQDDSGLGTIIKVNDPTGNSFVQGLNGKGFHLTGNNHVQITKANEGIFDLDTFQIDFDIKLDHVGTSGRIMGIHTSWDVRMLSNGSIRFNLPTDQGQFTITTATNVISDTNWHDVSFQYDGPSSSLEILVDGNVVGSGVATGTTHSAGHHGLVMGEYFGTSIQAVVDNLSMSVPPSDVYANLTSTGTVVNQPTTPVVTAPVIDPNAPVIDPNAPVIDPNAPVVDPNAPVDDTGTGTTTPTTDPTSGTGTTNTPPTDPTTGSGTTTTTPTGGETTTTPTSDPAPQDDTSSAPSTGSTETEAPTVPEAPAVDSTVILSSFNKSVMKLVSKFASKGDNAPNKPIQTTDPNSPYSNLTLRDLIKLISNDSDSDDPAVTTHGTQITARTNRDDAFDDEDEDQELMVM